MADVAVAAAAPEKTPEAAAPKPPLPSLPPYPDRFYAAARYAAVPGTVEVPAGNENTTPYTDLTCLALHSLYQQAARGPNKQPKPWAWNLVELAKWQSWKELGNMAPMEAMRLFVRALEEEDPDWWSKARILEAAAAQEAQAQQDAQQAQELEVEIAAIGLAPELMRAASSREWTVVHTKGRRPHGRYQHGALILDNKLFIIGGTSGRFLSDVQVLDLFTLTWTKMELSTDTAALPPCAGLSLVALNSTTILAVGGHTKDLNETMIVRAFDTQTFSWRNLKTVGDAPSARGGHSVSVVGDVVWVFGGEDKKRRLLNDVFCLHLTTLQWTAVQTTGTLPSARSDHVATVYNERYLTVFGGGSHSFCFNDIHVLDLETKEWSKADSYGAVPTPRAGHGGVAVGSQWFIAGGGDNVRGVSETLLLDLDTLEWSEVCSSQQRTPLSSEGLSLVKVETPLGVFLLAFGGYNGRYNNELMVMKAELQPRSDATPNGHATPLSPPTQREAAADQSEPSIPPPAAAAAAAAADSADASIANLAAAGKSGSSQNLPTASAVPAEGSGPAAASSSAPTPAPAPVAAPAPEPDAEAEALRRQLEETEAALVRAEKIALSTRHESNIEAAQARADAWLQIAHINKDMDELKEKLAVAVRAKLQAEDELRERQTELLAAQAASAKVQTEAQVLRKDLAETRSKVHDLEAELVRLQADGELSKLRKDYDVCKSALAEAEQELVAIRESLATEQARCFKLEVELAELRQRASEIGDLHGEIELLKRQLFVAEEAASEAGKEGRGWGGWLGGR